MSDCCVMDFQVYGSPGPLGSTGDRRKMCWASTMRAWCMLWRWFGATETPAGVCLGIGAAALLGAYVALFIAANCPSILSCTILNANKATMRLLSSESGLEEGSGGNSHQSEPISP